jgi:hypothetical protein
MTVLVGFYVFRLTWSALELGAGKQYRNSNSELLNSIQKRMCYVPDSERQISDTHMFILGIDNQKLNNYLT